MEAAVADTKAVVVADIKEVVLEADSREVVLEAAIKPVDLEATREAVDLEVDTRAMDNKALDLEVDTRAVVLEAAKRTDTVADTTAIMMDTKFMNTKRSLFVIHFHPYSPKFPHPQSN
ncbi:hypothetical protein CBL_20054 [Carabus blaptoides fortunei]